jgi:DNA-directed RNA polymerase subunit K/omega
MAETYTHLDVTDLSFESSSIPNESPRQNEYVAKYTSYYMTKYEYTRIIAFRVLRLTLGDPILLDKTDINYDGIKIDFFKIAKHELRERKLNIVIKRKLFNKNLPVDYDLVHIKNLLLPA